MARRRVAIFAICLVASLVAAAEASDDPTVCRHVGEADKEPVGDLYAGELEGYVDLFVRRTKDHATDVGRPLGKVLNGYLTEQLETLGLDLDGWNEEFPGSPLLFSEEEAGAEVQAFVERVALCASQNHYLRTFLVELQDKHVEALRSDYFPHTTASQNAQIAAALTYMHLLDRLTHTVRNSPVVTMQYLKGRFHSKVRGLMEDDYFSGSMFGSILDSLGVFDVLLKQHLVKVPHINLFEFVKKLGLDMAADSIVKYAEQRSLDGNGFRTGLPINIMEACLEDYRLGNPDNADAGLAMLKTGPELNTCRALGSRMGETSPDEGHAVWLYPFLPKRWADLYSTWNGAFVSHYRNAPFFYGKLFNPQVLCYDDKPQEYLHNRMVALWLHIYFELFTRIKNGAREPEQDWSSKTVTKVWARVNKESAADYTGRVNICKPQCDTEARTTDIGLMMKVVDGFREYTTKQYDAVDSSLDGMTKNLQSREEIVQEALSWWGGSGPHTTSDEVRQHVQTVLRMEQEARIYGYGPRDLRWNEDGEKSEAVPLSQREEKMLAGWHEANLEPEGSENDADYDRFRDAQGPDSDDDDGDDEGPKFYDARGPPDEGLSDSATDVSGGVLPRETSVDVGGERTQLRRVKAPLAEEDGLGGQV